MLKDLLFGLWFFLPAGFANAAPVFASRLRFLDFLDYPLDHNKTFKNKRIFGPHKTYRGLVTGVFIGILTAWLQFSIYSDNTWLRVNIDMPGGFGFSLLAGLLLSFGALGGDAVKSFFKRQLGKAAGSSWAPFDQLDYVIGGLALYSLVDVLDPPQYLAVAFVWVVMHPLATTVAWLLRLKDSPI